MTIPGDIPQTYFIKQAFVLAQSEAAARVKRMEIKEVDEEIRDLQAELRRKLGQKKRLQDQLHNISKRKFIDD